MKSHRVPLAIAAAFLGGAIAGAVFYPNRKVEERERRIAQLSAMLRTYEDRTRELEAKTRETILVVERPDGSRRTRVVRKVETKENMRIAESRAASQNQRIDTERDRLEETNALRFGVAVGMRTDRAYFAHVDGTLVGPVFFVGHADSFGRFGVGIGIRF